MKQIGICIWILGGLLLAFGCDNTPTHQHPRPDGGTDADISGDTDGDAPNPPAKLATLHVWPLSIWGDRLPQNMTSITVSGPQGARSLAVEPNSEIAIEQAGAYELCVVSVDFRDFCTNFTVSPAGEMAGFERAPHETAGLLVRLNRPGADGLPASYVAVGLAHAWFSSQGRPMRTGNRITLLMDGEEAWAQVHDELQRARREILMASWWWQSDFELVRPMPQHLDYTQQQRWANTVVGVLEASPAVKRILVGEFWGTHDILDWITRDDAILSYAETPDDGFEFMGQGNPTSDQFHFEVAPFDFRARFAENFPMEAGLFPDEQWIASEVPGKDVDFSDWPAGVAFQAASWHQKFSVMDQQIAFVGGMNVKSTDWDTSAHLVYEPRRMEFSATADERRAVQAKQAEPDLGPRKDYVLRIEGPAARDVADVFLRRWSYLISTGATYSENATPFTIDTDPLPENGDARVQITATMPVPFSENAILETWYNAVRNARESIFIEDQYFRIPYLTGAIADRMALVPDLKLVVITKPINEWTDGGCYWTYRTVQELRTLFPSRVFVFQLRSFDTVVTWGIDETESRFTGIDTHSKMLIVDDTFLSVGSCNKNNRGVIYEGELNAAVLNPDWVRTQRIRIVDNMAGSAIGARPDWIFAMVQAAAANDQVYAAWESEGFDISLDGAPLPDRYTPHGFLYSLNFPDPTECLVEDIGPDLF